MTGNSFECTEQNWNEFFSICCRSLSTPNAFTLSPKKQKTQTRMTHVPRGGVDSVRTHLSLETEGGGKCHSWCVESGGGWCAIERIRILNLLRVLRGIYDARQKQAWHTH